MKMRDRKNIVFSYSRETGEKYATKPIYRIMFLFLKKINQVILIGG